MTYYKFEGSIVVEATSEEDALSNIAGRVAAISRHLGNEESLESSEPFFTLKETTDDGTTPSRGVVGMIKNLFSTDKER